MKKIKIIVSHDVDHLFARDHRLRDLFFPKLIVRSTIALLKGKLSASEWWLRCTSFCTKRINNIDELMEFDKRHGVESTYFFGMANGLSMSYKPFEAKDIIESVKQKGFPTGVHGIAYNNLEKMQQEYNAFIETMGYKPCGIRMHCVRYDNSTFEYANTIGYFFDTTEFDKETRGTLKNPYKKGNMWEFPLAIMDVYLPDGFENAKKKTMQILNEAKERRLDYITVLFHDYHFCNAYRDMKNWYQWLIEYLDNNEEYSFISYEEAIVMLEGH